MQKNAVKKLDMTEGKPLKLLIMFAIPIFIGNVFQLLYNMVDSVIAGKFIGPDALAVILSSLTERRQFIFIISVRKTHYL